MKPINNPSLFDKYEVSIIIFMISHDIAFSLINFVIQTHLFQTETWLANVESNPKMAWDNF